MMFSNTQKGGQGESIAMEHLKQKGYTILHQNWRHQHLELDIVATIDKILVIVEVKLRSSDAFGTPEAFVTKSKQKKLIKAAGFYIRDNNIDYETRFDVISIIQNSHQLVVQHMMDAFYPIL